MHRIYMAARELIDLFKTMEREIIKGGGKENTQPYRMYEKWLSEIEGYINNIIYTKTEIQRQRQMNMNNFSRKDYEITESERRNNKPISPSLSPYYLEKKSREERLKDIVKKQTERIRGKGEWLY
jgi:hypothetical protein